MRLYNRNSRTIYKKSIHFILMIWMCIIGYAKIPLIIYMLYTSKQIPFKEDYSISIDDILDRSTLEFFGGVAISILALIRFDYRWSRRLIILITESIFALGLALIYWKIKFSYIPFGFSASISMVIYPLYLYEQSYESEFANLANYLQFSFVFGAFFIKLYSSTGFQESQGYVLAPLLTIQQFCLALMCLSVLNGLFINYGNGIKETILCQYMRDKLDIGNNIISLLLKEDHVRIQNYFVSERQKRKQLLNAYTLLNQQAQIQPIAQMKRNQIKKNVKMLIFTFLIPFTQIFLLEIIYEQSYYLTSNDTVGDLAITPSLTIIFAVAAQILCFFVNHTYLLKRGFQISFLISVICLIEYLIQDKNFTQFQKYVNLILLIIVFCSVTSVWRVRIFSNINLNFIWVHQIIFWLAFFLFFINVQYLGILIIQMISFFIGYLLVNFN